MRLGQRTIQKTAHAPIILTGFQALNKLLGSSVYSSNEQLGGPTVMHPNGVSHLLVHSHMESVSAAIEWLAFVPSRRGAPLPVVDISGLDTIERPVVFRPAHGVPYDPRHLLAGFLVDASTSRDAFVPGFFDRASFVETLAGWAKTVIVGRARLGGIPVGVIVTENRTVEATKPADPADPSSQETTTPQAGGVWFPDSAHKTAQAINDFRSEDLPLFIFANWRGFSGGQRDMFDEILKFGAMIVDALVGFSRPIFVYIPPHSELRGGAWVVVDSTINADVMEMFAADQARGGVLEATGIVEIKYRKQELIATMRRLDPELARLAQILERDKSTETEPGARLSESDLAATEKRMKEREAKLLPIFNQIAIQARELTFTRTHHSPVGSSASAHLLSPLTPASHLPLSRRHRCRLFLSRLSLSGRPPARRALARVSPPSLQFADLHDTPGRMAATGVITREVEWASSRAFFYWRLRRKITEFELREQVVNAACSPPASGAAAAAATAGAAATPTVMTGAQASQKLREWFVASGNEPSQWQDDKACLAWLEQSSEWKARLQALRDHRMAEQVAQLFHDDSAAAAKAVAAACAKMDPAQRERVKQALASVL